MSQSDRSERVDLLRDAIARIESDGSLAPSFGGRAMGHIPPSPVPLGRDLALDKVLAGGLARGALHEVVAARPGDAGAASGFALALAIRFAAEKTETRTKTMTSAPVVWIVEDAALAENGAPYAPGLSAHGLDPDRLIVVRTANGQDSLWAMEEALKCRAGAVVADLWRTKAYDLVASRRLALAAQKSGTPGLLVPGAAGTARTISSAARTRFEVRAAPGRPAASAADRTPLPGRAAWSVRLARIRAGPAGGSVASFGFDWEKFWPLVWDHEEAWFCDALPLPPYSPAFDRSPAPVRRDVGARTNHERVA